MSFAASLARHRLATNAALVIGALGCTGSDRTGPVSIGPTLTVAPTSVDAIPGVSVTLTATLLDLPASTLVRWQSHDSTVFRLDTTTTSAHRVSGRTGRAGPTIIVVSAAGQAMTIPVTITPLAGGADR